jgi:hypothetical protein
LLITLLLAGLAAGAIAADVDEFRVKRREVFEFAEPPQVVRRGDRCEIRFTAKDFCDATVVIEDPRGRIVRHLAGGVLGENPPAPFQPRSLTQSIAWDGKDDQGRYVDQKEAHTVRVSLGLKPSFERVLFWEPKKRSQQEASCIQAAEEGVYVYDGRVLDHVRLFDHDGNYLRTVYPFPANKLDAVQGLHEKTFPQDGARLPLREGFHQATLLSSGTNAGFDEKLGIGVDRYNNYHGAVWGNAASVMAVRGGQIALARLHLNRLAADGTSGGLPLSGPPVTFNLASQKVGRRGEPLPVAPRSAAFSPDGRWLYLTGYVQPNSQAATRDIVLIGSWDWLPGVARLDFRGDSPPEVFLGSMELAGAGNQDGRFDTPTSVAIDPQGRVYVSDYLNNRLQVFSSDGKHLRSIAAAHPAQVSIHQKTGEIYVFSWEVPNRNGVRKNGPPIEAALTVLRSLDDPRPLLTCPLPLGPLPSRGSGVAYRAEIDSWTDPPSVWLVAEWGRDDFLTRSQGGQRLKHPNVMVYKLVDGELKLHRDFDSDVRASVVRTEAPEYARQRLYVDPVRGHLYVGEGQAASGKSFRDVVRIDPETGQATVIKLPFDAEDMCFDADGLAYLRTFQLVARYDPRDWREVPFDYGEEHAEVRTSSSRDARPTPVMSAIALPVEFAGLHHHGGMAVSPQGHLVVAVNNSKMEPVSRKDVYDEPVSPAGTPYAPRLYPGRVRWGEIHVFDKHGQMVFQDAVPGMLKSDGLGIDKDNNIFVLSTAQRVLDGRPYFNDMTGTLVKVKANGARVLSASDRASVPLPEEDQPQRPPQLASGGIERGWIEGAQWLYGGLGFAGKFCGRSGGGCDCYNARFALDYLGRSFAPEVDHSSVAVLDSAGNLILRVGRYGNEDSAGPQSLVPLGGDEVGLFYAPYVAVDTEHRLFIADPGNSRIVSVLLDYHQTQRVALRNVPDLSAQDK